MNIRTFFRDLYLHDMDRMPPAQRAITTFFRFAYELKHQFVLDTVVVRASGMAYTTLLAIVPLIAVIFSIFTAFPAFAEFRNTIQQSLFQQIVPTRTDEILEYINQFTQNTKALGLFSIPFLMLTSVLWFDNIEKNFNALWHLTKPRSMMRRFTSFTMVLVWGPMLIALSFYTSRKLRMLFQGLDIGILQRTVFGMFPWLITVAAFFMMLLVIPATKVKYRSALIGGAIGGTVWEFAKIGFSHYVAKSITYSAIYGSLALIPIFLVWLYLTWIIVLVSVEISYVHHNFNSLVLHRAFAKLSTRDRLHLALRIYASVAEGFHKGQPPFNADILAERFAVPLELVEDILNQFSEKGLLVKTETDDESSGFVPARSLDSLMLKDVVEAAYMEKRENGELPTIDQVDESVRGLLTQGEKAASSFFEKSSMLAIVSQIPQKKE